MRVGTSVKRNDGSRAGRFFTGEIKQEPVPDIFSLPSKSSSSSELDRAEGSEGARRLGDANDFYYTHFFSDGGLTGNKACIHMSKNVVTHMRYVSGKHAEMSLDFMYRNVTLNGGVTLEKFLAQIGFSDRIGEFTLSQYGSGEKIQMYDFKNGVLQDMYIDLIMELAPAFPEIEETQLQPSNW